MPRWLPATPVTLLSAAVLGLALPAAAQQTVPTIAYDSVPEPLKLPPNVHLGEVAGVAVNSKRHVFVYSRGNVRGGPAYAAAAAQLLEFDQNGRFVREIGKDLYSHAYAHVVRIDKADNIWIVDKGSDMIVRFNPAGRVTMVFGRKQEASDLEAHPWERGKNPPYTHEDGRFRQPTDVTWDPAGNIFISDGYVNSRVAKLDKDGNWIKSWGQRGKGPGEFDLPHSIAADAKGNVYVADRTNGRIQVFDSDGNFLSEIKMNIPVPPNAKPAIGNVPAANVTGTMAPGAPWAICITPQTASSPSQVLYAADAFPGRIYKLSLDGKLLGTLGEAGKTPKKFGWIHEIACPSENELWVAEILNWRVQKLLLKP